MRRLSLSIALVLLVGLSAPAFAAMPHYAKRTTFLVGADDTITKVCQDGDPDKNPAQVLHHLALLEAAS